MQHAEWWQESGYKSQANFRGQITNNCLAPSVTRIISKILTIKYVYWYKQNPKLETS